ncbi:unnamed protein product [Tuber melanosporum]|uniref:(Perigord truffle) hypothetical protein n=1 Tax=Tuber melanosporum (strain Mel28) TaxID=656061 RepID=D5GK98_TUBMM|nr:uncharacterized protein GSTUM_00009438001 [Tuber melanosporum]CAZ84941.1 unnamed protein product [Tuber melanosporum]
MNAALPCTLLIPKYCPMQPEHLPLHLIPNKLEWVDPHPIVVAPTSKGSKRPSIIITISPITIPDLIIRSPIISLQCLPNPLHASALPELIPNLNLKVHKLEPALPAHLLPNLHLHLQPRLQTLWHADRKTHAVPSVPAPLHDPLHSAQDLADAREVHFRRGLAEAPRAPLQKGRCSTRCLGRCSGSRRSRLARWSCSTVSLGGGRGSGLLGRWRLWLWVGESRLELGFYVSVWDIEAINWRGSDNFLKRPVFQKIAVPPEGFGGSW